MLQQDRSRLLATRSLVLLVLCTALSSFSERTGGDTFTIYLNKKLLIQEHVLPEAAIKNLALSPADANAILRVHYSHCGQIGAERSLSIRDRDDNILKTWDFTNNASPVMDFAVKEVLTLKKASGNQRLQLLYSSRELPKGKVLASIILPDDTKASLR